MSDIRDLAAPLIAHPLVAPPAIEDVVMRVHRARVRRRRRRAVVASALFVVTGSARWTLVGPSTNVASERVADPEVHVPMKALPEPPSAQEHSPGGLGADVEPTRPGPNGPSHKFGTRGIACEPGRNGGATDAGVTGTNIKLFMNITADGPNAAATSEVRHVVTDLVNTVNRTGGICGRLLNLSLRNGWHQPPADTFAMLVAPLKTELDTEIDNGTVARRRIPIVGTDGLTEAQSQSPWVWPVGTSLARQARIAVDHAYHRDGARTFAMVHDGTPTALEAVAAFQEHVGRLRGAQVRVVHQVDDPASAYNTACGNGACDAVVLAVSPAGFSDWRSGRPPTARLRTAGLSPMLNAGVINDCAALLAPDACPNLRIWTPYTPPLAAFTTDPAVAAYAEASSDDLNPLTEGAYIGALTLIEALKKVGPNLTREHLRQTLDSMDYDSGLVDLLKWRPGHHAGNVSARAIGLENGSFVDARTGWVRDPLAGLR